MTSPQWSEWCRCCGRKRGKHPVDSAGTRCAIFMAYDLEAHLAKYGVEVR